MRRTEEEQAVPRPDASLRGDWFDALSRSREPGPSLGKDLDRAVAASEIDLVGGHLGECSMDLATKAVHAGQYDDPRTGAVGTPIFQSSTFLLNNETYASVDEGWARERFIYARYGAPNQWAVQEKVAALHGAQSGVVFSSGMAAITTTVLALVDLGGHVVTSRDLYGGTYGFFHEDVPQLGRSRSFVDPTDLAAVEAAIRPETQLLYFEALTNPLLKLVDVAGMVAIARRRGLRVVIDNTFLSPINLRPLEHGVDVVVESASKYLNGHTDLIAGVAVGSRKLLDGIWGLMLKLGSSLDPHACFLLERGLKTLALRMEAHQRNAAELADWLLTRSEVRAVHWLGHGTHPQAALAAQLLNGFGGMIGLEVNGTDQDAEVFVRALQLPRLATSLGGVESLVSLPWNTSHAGLLPTQMREIGIAPGFVRFSVGIESVRDLRSDLERALQVMSASRDRPELESPTGDETSEARWGASADSSRVSVPVSNAAERKVHA